MLKVINPFDGSVVGEHEVDTAESIAEKLLAARKSSWALTGYEFRASCLAKFGELLTERLEEAARLLSAEVGKPVNQARNEIKGTRQRVEFFVEEAGGLLKPEIVHSDEQSGLKEEIRYEPLGVVGSISAWNYPYFVGSNVYVPALLAGNRVLYKPSEFCLGTGKFMAELLYEAGVPHDAFQVIAGDGKVGAQLVDADVDGVFFTGSVTTGKKISASLAGRLIPLQLELGGKDPVYVCEDVDPAGAAAGLADGAFYNAGQSCCSVERIYVHKESFDEFVEAFVKEVKSFKIGDPSAEETYIGPLTRASHVDFLLDQVEDAKSKGAIIHCGGHAGKQPGFFEPTVVTQVNHQMKLMREESFGPIIGIMAVDNDEEALEKMNDTTYGLTAGVFTKDASRAELMMMQLRAGSVYWNCCDRVSPRLPWSGWKDSGIGLTLSHLGVRNFARPKAYHWRKG